MAAVWLWIRSERRRRAPALLIVAIVALAAGAGMAAFAGARRADSALERFGTATGQQNLELTVEAFETGSGTIDATRLVDSVDLIDEAAAVPGVEAVTHFIFWAITPEPDADCSFGFGIARSTVAHPLGVTIAGGSSGAADAVTVNEAAASMFGLEVGSGMRLRTTSAANTAEWLGGDGCAPVDGPEIPVRVATVAKGLEDITDFPEPLFAVGPAFYDRYVDEVAGCACSVLVRADPDRVDEVRTALEALYGPYGFASQPVEALEERAAATIGLEVDALRIAALVVSIVGLLVVIQVIGRQAAALAADHRNRRALGMTRHQIAGGTALAMVPPIVAGALLAVVGAAAVSGFLPRGLARRAEPAPGIRIDAVVLAGGFAVTVVVASGAAWIVGWMMAGPARRGTTRPVRGAIGPLPTPVAFGVGMATNPAGDRGRVAAWSGVLGIAVAVAGALAVWTVGASAEHLRHTPSLYGVSADFAVTTEVDDPGAAANAAIGTVLADPDVEAAARVLRIDPVAAHGPAGSTVSVEPEALRPERGLIGPTIRSGRLATSSDEVVLGRATAAALGTELGDHVTVTRVDNSSVDYAVVGLAVSYGTDVVDQGFHVTEDGIERLAVPCGTDGSDGGEEESCADADVWTVVARAAPGADRDALGDRLDKVDMVPIPAPSIVDRFREIGPVPWYLAGMLAVLGAGGLMHSSLMASRRRGRELAIARVSGSRRAKRPPRSGGRAWRRRSPGSSSAWPQGSSSDASSGATSRRRSGSSCPYGSPHGRWPSRSAGVLVVVLAVTSFPSARVRRARPAELLRTE